VTESGRQPWLAYGILRTADAISPVPAASIAGTLALFVVCYGIVFSMGIYYINRLIAQGPKGRAIEDLVEGLPNRPIAAAGAAASDAMSGRS
jgi:cytochrome bd ubiquinol oxidase subunit I